MILDSKNVQYETIDITEPGKEEEKEFMQTHGIAREGKYPLPPQIFNEEDYCGDYEDFDLANEIDELEEFLKVAPPASATATTLDSKKIKDIQENGNTTSREPSSDKDAVAVQEESVEERTTLPNENAESNESKPLEHDGGTNIATEEATDHPEENVEKNEEKSDDQEKEE
ncbi:SH3 domain-binding glutamic acid-rich protein homolog isoform X2 [Hylaeus anthracinus]|nr:SH3 domain-binding glutamic acid-rich protein homolog isoform X2 [Hylaeus volcanicus]XP_054007084.1 SH3 domain-binding glutamic acid-rich protein homolog isoform X2 [Hylaeus anthracinus]